MEKQRIVSGIQPTGSPHLGNYLGMLKQSMGLQKEANTECYYFLADLHALTIKQNPKHFAEQVLSTAIDCLALGLDPERATLFVQSQVPQHTELAWILDTLAPISELERMTQYKEKAHEHVSNLNMGLLNYPVLMAADILLYKGTLVPVGEDQVQHIELTRVIVRKFSQQYGECFAEPKPRLTQTARVMSLIDPTKKMSKSHGVKTYIALSDEPDVIRKKIAKAVTATSGRKAIDPGVQNLFAIMREISGPEVLQKYEEAEHDGSIRYAEFKKQLAEDLITHLEPYRQRRADLEKKPIYVKAVLEEGRRKAAAIAEQTMAEVRDAVGLLQK